MKKILFVAFSLFFLANNSQAQCGGILACNTNTGLFSNNVANDIAYDNMGSAFHSTFIKETNGVWKVWGENMGNNGIAHVLTPQVFDATNYPALTGNIYKMAIGSNSINTVQLIVLTSTGLFSLGSEGSVISANLTTSAVFQKLTINGQTNGLPLGLQPEDIKMMFASTDVLTLTTCSGAVYTLAKNTNLRGGSSSFPDKWYQVMENATTPLSNVIVARGNCSTAFALKSDGSLWTWGENTFLGNGTAVLARAIATQMTLPAGLTGVKMIQTTLDNLVPTYYVLGTDKKVYTLGTNLYGQAADNTLNLRNSWVNAKNPGGTIITDANWISSNEHDKGYPNIAVIKSSGLIYTAGFNSSYMIGRVLSANINFLGLPQGITASDVITFAEVGGHTCALIKQCNNRYGYVGHRINGSMGEGTASSSATQNYDFATPPIINVCGTAFATPTITPDNAQICIGQNAVFNFTGFAGQTITYNLNNGSNQTVIIDANGRAVVTVAGPIGNISMNITQIGTSSSCIIPIAVTSTINLNTIVSPAFSQISPICNGATLAALPTTSSNGITGTWSPVINNAASTTYTFTPNVGQCANPQTMTVVVNNNPINTLPIFNVIAPICAGQTISPLPTNSNNGITGSWSPAPNNLQTTTYTFNPDSGQCATSNNLQIIVNPNVLPTFTPVASINSGQTLQPLPTSSLNGISGSWSPALNNTQTTTYTFTPTIGQCASPTTLTINVNTVTNITPTFTAVAAICIDDVMNALPTQSLEGIIGTWSPALNNQLTTTYTFSPLLGQNANTTTLTIIVNNKTVPSFTAIATICEGEFLASLPTTSNNGITGSWSPAVNNLSTTDYLFTPTSGLCATTQTLRINVNLKIIPAFNPVLPICNGGTINALPTTSLNGIAGTWSPPINNTSTTDYTFTPNLGICATTQTLRIVVNAIVTPTFNAIASICEGDFLAPLPNVSLNGISGTWSPTLSNLVSDTYTFTPLPNSSGICANSSNLSITVNIKKTPTFSPIADLCFGESIPVLPNVSNNGISGNWTPNIVNNNQTTTYQFTPTAGQCTNNTVPITIKVINEIIFEIQSECVGANYVYKIVPTNNSFDINNVSISWKDFNNATIGNNQLFDITDYLIKNAITPNFPILITANVSLSNNCKKSVPIIINNIYCGIQKGISPNGDNKNDFFDLQLLDVKNLKIFNRYGMVVYNLGNYTKEWTGQDNSGTQLPDGTYFYEIEFNNNADQKIGWIYLNKEVKD